MMNFLELAKKRRSVRSYTSQTVEEEKLHYLLECARLAPSAVNRQPWHFFVVKSEEKKHRLRQCYARDWFAQAPLYIVICADDANAWVRQADGKNHADIDAAIAIEHLCLAAADLGLGTCWVCNFDVVKCSELLALPSNQRPVAISSRRLSRSHGCETFRQEGTERGDDGSLTLPVSTFLVTLS